MESGAAQRDRTPRRRVSRRRAEGAGWCGAEKADNHRAVVGEGGAAQAAGRIRRLGQTKDVLIKRFAYRNSLDESICKLHDAVKRGDVKIVDGQIPGEGIRIITAA